MSMLFSVLLAAATPVQGDVAKIGWLAGAWRENAANGEWTEEYWTPVRGQLMIGAGLTGRGESVRHFEQLRIWRTADGKVMLHANPNGAAGASFALVRQTADEIVFENAENDYPQRVTYRRVGDKVEAAISLIDGKEERRWSYSRP
jgi:hypothetical protein